MKKYDVIIAGGGLAGLIAAILLSAKNKKVLLVEKRAYPFHKVCGEYVSNEALDFFHSLGFFPSHHGASAISKLRISAPSGKNYFLSLHTGGFGLSRFTLDHALFKMAVKNGAETINPGKVTDIHFHNNEFTVTTGSGENFKSCFVIGSYGKRDQLDKILSRRFALTRTGYMAIKYHIFTDYPPDEVGLDNFSGGYCGIVKIEEDRYNLCYLYKRDPGIKLGSIRELEETILFRNPVIRSIFSSSEFLFPAPEVISEISFAPRKLIENHILMCGDTAGLITPLCGNGMAMAIHSAVIASDLLSQCGTNITKERRINVEREYHKKWERNFGKRLFWGRMLQGLLLNNAFSEYGIRCMHAVPFLERWLIRQTHGKQIPVIE